MSTKLKPTTTDGTLDLRDVTNAPSRFRSTVTNDEIDRAILQHCHASQRQLTELMEAMGRIGGLWIHPSYAGEQAQLAIEIREAISSFVAGGAQPSSEVVL